MEKQWGKSFSSLTLIENLKPNYDIIIGIHKKGLFYNYCKKNKIKFYFLNKDFFQIKKDLTKYNSFIVKFL